MVIRSRQRFLRLLSPALVALLALAGCGDSKTDSKTSPKPQAKHPPHGPNHGHLFELEAEGGEHLHVEFFEDEKAKKLVAVLRENQDLAYLYRELTTLRLDVPIEETLDDLEWKGVPRPTFKKLCASVGFDPESIRVHRWAE